MKHPFNPYDTLFSPATKTGTVPPTGAIPESRALVSRMTVAPSESRKVLIAETIGELKTAGIWSLLDEIWFFAAHDSQAALLGWKDTVNSSLAGAPVFDTDRGITTRGATGYVKLGFIPSSHGVNYQTNDASFGQYNRKNIRFIGFDMGCQNSSSENLAHIVSAWHNGSSYARINQDVSDSGSGAVSDTCTGLTVARRSASDSKQTLRDGVIIDTQATASTGVSDFEFYMGGNNSAGVFTNSVARQYSAAYVGAALTESQHLALFNIIETYLSAVGADVTSDVIPQMSSTNWLAEAATLSSNSKSTSALQAEFGAVYESGVSQFAGAVATPNGKIYHVRLSAAEVLVVNTVTSSAYYLGAAAGVPAQIANSHLGGCLGVDGKIYCPPAAGSGVMVIDPVNDTVEMKTYGLAIGGNFFGAAVSAPNGLIYCPPYSSTRTLVIDPIAQTATLEEFGMGAISGTAKWLSAALAPNGEIWCVPHNATNFLVINTNNNTARFHDGTGIDSTYMDQTGKWWGATLGPDGKIYGSPFVANAVLVIDPVADEVSIDTYGLTLASYIGGSVGVDGLIYIPGNTGAHIIRINPATQTADLQTYGLTIPSSAYAGITLAPDGNLYTGPRNAEHILRITTPAANILPSVDFTVSPYSNKS